MINTVLIRVIRFFMIRVIKNTTPIFALLSERKKKVRHIFRVEPS